MNESSAAIHPRTTSSSTNRFENSNHDGDSRRRRPRPVGPPRLFAPVLAIATMKICLRGIGSIAVAHNTDIYFRSQAQASSPNFVNDRRERRNRNKHYSRFLYDCFSLEEACNSCSKNRAHANVDVICDVICGRLFEYDSHHNGELCHYTPGYSSRRIEPNYSIEQFGQADNRSLKHLSPSSLKKPRDHDNSIIQHHLHHYQQGQLSQQLSSSQQLCFHDDTLTHFSGSLSRSSQNYLQIHRGGANRFVEDDEHDKYGNNKNDNNGKTAGMGLRKHSPVVYQHFGRSRSRGGGHPHHSQADDAPLNFILLGPNVDHWKTVGQTLASRGFNVMACERMVEDDQKRKDKHHGYSDEDGGNEDNKGRTTIYEDAPELVLEILDALKWDKAVLVGCDDESSLAMETAMMLAPDRVAGLILCGDLTAANRLAEETGGVRVLDSFLLRVLDCPFVIVWDGGARSIVSGASAHEAIETTQSSSPFGDGDGVVGGRCVILGGGSAPHRTKPEYFAWILARFVEEKLEHHSMDNTVDGKRKSIVSESTSLNNNDSDRKTRQHRGGIMRNLNLPFGIDSLVSPEGRLLLGRAIAAAIFYTSIMKVVFVQYGILRIWWISIKNSVDSVDALRRKIVQVMGAFLWNFGYVPKLFKFSLKRTKELDNEDGIDSSSKIETEEAIPEKEETDGNTSFNPPSKSSDEDGTDDSQQEDEDEDNEDAFRIRPLFFLDNIFT